MSLASTSILGAQGCWQLLLDAIILLSRMINLSEPFTESRLRYATKQPVLTNIEYSPTAILNSCSSNEESKTPKASKFCQF